MKVYQEIGSARLLNIKVILDDTQEIYTGMVEDAPDEIKKMKYSNVKLGTPVEYYVYSNIE